MNLTHDPKRIKRKRFEAGLSLTETAEKAGVTKSHLSSAEHGRANFSPPNLAKIAAVLGCKIVDLMPDEDEPASTPGSAA